MYHNNTMAAGSMVGRNICYVFLAGDYFPMDHTKCTIIIAYEPDRLPMMNVISPAVNAAQHVISAARAAACSSALLL